MPLRSFIHVALVMFLTCGYPVAAQLSPAQIKVQKERAARAEAAKREAERQRAAMAAKANADAKAAKARTAQQNAIKLAADRRERERKNNLFAEERRKAVANGQISLGYMVGTWAENDPSHCNAREDPDVRFKFDESGEWGAYEAGGKWTVANGNLVLRYPNYDGDGDPYGSNNLIGYTDRASVVSDIAENLLIVSVDGGSTAWFRCAENTSYLATTETPRRMPNAPEYAYFSDSKQWEDYQEIRDLWAAGKFDEAFLAIRSYNVLHPKLNYGDSEILNYAGLYLWKNGNNPKAAAMYFLQNYQLDPAGDRAADSLLSAAEIFYELGDTDRFCTVKRKFLSDYAFEAKYRLSKRLSAANNLAACQ